jgi:hypothetical protein
MPDVARDLYRREGKVGRYDVTAQPGPASVNRIYTVAGEWFRMRVDSRASGGLGRTEQP